ncbi:hypothetical protein C0583_02860 [Candidatus Parcubacteria bacterium]|nr:MAG: hypothetical protein C0583_02860 [Candidatus Parcubacteria bacterium]
MADSPKFLLNKLFGSTARVKILKLFLAHPNERFYIRQLARDTGLQLNSVRRELDNLEDFGLLKTSQESDGVMGSEEDEESDEEKKPKKPSKTEKKYYQIEKTFILYEEIKALFMKAQVLYEKDFSEKILAAGRPKLMILTGFFTNVDDAPSDLLLVGALNKTKLTKIIKELELELGREVNYTLMDMNEFIYRRDITDVFLYEILENENVVVIDELEAA